MVDELSGNMGVLTRLQDFAYKDKNGKDWGLNVRHRAKELAALVSDPERVRVERNKVCPGPTSAPVIAHCGLWGCGSANAPVPLPLLCSSCWRCPEAHASNTAGSGLAVPGSGASRGLPECRPRSPRRSTRACPPTTGAPAAAARRLALAPPLL